MLPSQTLLLLCHLDNDLVIIIYNNDIDILWVTNTQTQLFLTPPPKKCFFPGRGVLA